MNRFDSGPFTRFHRVGNQKQLHEQGGQVGKLPLELQQQWLDNIAFTHQSGKFPGTILPMLTDRNVVYYALARSPREWRRLAPLLRAFVGPTTLKEFPVCTSDPRDRELLNLGYAVIKKFSVPKDVPQNLFEQWKLRAIRALNNLALGVINAPDTKQQVPRSLAELLDRFELALNAGDFQGCNDIIEELRAGNHLDHMNLSFLRVRMFQRAGDWGGLVQWQSFERLCKTRRPGRISGILVKALYRVKLTDLGNDVEALAERFRTAILPVCGDLFQKLPASVDLDILRAFAIHAVVTGQNPHRKQLSDLAGQSGAAGGASFWNDCLNLIDSDSDGAASKTTKTLPPTKDDLLNAIAVAYVEDSPEKARAAIELFDTFSDEARAEMLARGRISDMWHYLTTVLVGDWENCFKALCTSSDDESALLLLEALNRWEAGDLMAGGRNAAQVLGLLEEVAASETGTRHLVENLQSLVTWFMEDPSFPREEGVPVYAFLLELYALSERITSQRLESFSELLGSVLACSISPEMYVRVLEAAILLVDQNEAHKAVDWLTDLAGISLDHHAPVPAIREQLLWNVLLKIKALGVELSEWQREALRVLSRALQQDVNEFLSELPTTQGDSPLTLCADKSLAIYTLDENSGKRAKEIINTVCPTARVSLNTDKSGSVGLKHLARNSDIFVVVWKSAKHAATTDIKQNRPNDKPILQPIGKGTSSILRVLEDYLRESDTRASLLAGPAAGSPGGGQDRTLLG